MKCKICGATTEARQVGLAFGLRATCPCAKIRTRERAKGCPRCGIKADHEHPNLNLYLKKRIFRKPFYEMQCIRCGHKWRVEL